MGWMGGYFLRSWDLPACVSRNTRRFSVELACVRDWESRGVFFSVAVLRWPTTVRSVLAVMPCQRLGRPRPVGCWRDVSLTTWSWWFQRGPSSTAWHKVIFWCEVESVRVDGRAFSCDPMASYACCADVGIRRAMPKELPPGSPHISDYGMPYQYIKLKVPRAESALGWRYH